MRISRLLLWPVAGFLCGSVALASDLSFKPYVNERFATQADVPADFVADPPPVNNDGRRFRGSDGGTVTVYATEPPEKLAAKFRLRPDPQGDIEILQRFWNFPNPEGYPANLVPAMLIYADLIASGDPRNLDIARKIHDTNLAP